MNLLRARFGDGRFSVQLLLDQWTILAPEALDENDVRAVCWVQDHEFSGIDSR